MLLALGAGLWGARRWPDSSPALACPPEDVRWLDAGAIGFAVCAEPGKRVSALPAAWARMLGQKLDLNLLSEDDLARVPGIGKKLASALAQERQALGGFKSWGQVDAVHGVGPAKLRLLQDTFEIRPLPSP
jgi:competence protein ComEA